MGLTVETEWDGYAADTPEGALLAEARARLDRGDHGAAASSSVPATLSDRDPAATSTQAAFGRTLLELSRVEGVAERLVTVAPDVSTSTNLGGFINKTGVWGPDEEPVYDAMEDSPLKWRVGPTRPAHRDGDRRDEPRPAARPARPHAGTSSGERLFPIGTLYDPFVMRALEGIVYSTYSGSRFVLAGTPSGISLSREGGAHQSLSTPGIGIETPGLTYAEPCYARELEWLLLDALAPHADARRRGALPPALDDSRSTRRRSPQRSSARRRGAAARRHRRRRLPAPRARRRATSGSCSPPAARSCPRRSRPPTLLAEEEGVEATVLCLSSPTGSIATGRRADAPLRGGTVAASHLERLVAPDERGLPVVTVIDGASHALSFVGSALGVRSVPLGVDRFGQTGSQPEVYAEYGIDAASIATAALVALEPGPD